VKPDTLGTERETRSNAEACGCSRGQEPGECLAGKELPHVTGDAESYILA